MEKTDTVVKNRISIIMGIYNCAGTLQEAVDSIIKQTYKEWELIMCDDCSTDNTLQIALQYKKKYPDKIIVLKNKRNRRLAYSLNHCLTRASGEYIARMDGDDISLPDRFEKQVKYLKDHPEIDLVGTAIQRFNDDGMADIVYAVDAPNYYTLRYSMPFHHATIVARRYVYDRLGGYTVAERTNRAQDYDLWFRFYNEGFKGSNLREPLYLVREDAAAIRRRTFNVRWNAYKTTIYGFDLLGYPKWWLIRPAIVMVLKSIVPFRIVELYREMQKRIDALQNKIYL